MFIQKCCSVKLMTLISHYLHLHQQADNIIFPYFWQFVVTFRKHVLLTNRFRETVYRGCKSFPASWIWINAKYLIISSFLYFVKFRWVTKLGNRWSDTTFTKLHHTHRCWKSHWSSVWSTLFFQWPLKRSYRVFAR